MALYIGEEEVWKCPKHPLKRRRNGICAVCLRDRLVILCPDCAKVRPCACCASSTASSSSSGSSSFSLFSSSSCRSNGVGGGGGGCDGVGSVGRVSNLIDGEPAFRRSRSVGIPLLRFGSRRNRPAASDKSNKTPSSFWSVFKSSKIKGSGESEKEELKSNDSHVHNFNEFTDSKIEDFARMMMKSRSVSVTSTYSGGADGLKSPAKSKGWHFPSPMKVFRQSRASKLVHERSPLHRG